MEAEGTTKAVIPVVKVDGWTHLFSEIILQLWDKQDKHDDTTYYCHCKDTEFLLEICLKPWFKVSMRMWKTCRITVHSPPHKDWQIQVGIILTRPLYFNKCVYDAMTFIIYCRLRSGQSPKTQLNPKFQILTHWWRRERSENTEKQMNWHQRVYWLIQVQCSVLNDFAD